MGTEGSSVQQKCGDEAGQWGKMGPGHVDIERAEQGP